MSEVTMAMHDFFWWSHGCCVSDDPKHEGPHACDCGMVYDLEEHGYGYGYDADEAHREHLMRKHGYDPELPPRGVASGDPPAGLRNHVCELEDFEIDGHSDPDNTGLCVYCSAEIEDVPW